MDLVPLAGEDAKSHKYASLITNYISLNTEKPLPSFCHYEMNTFG